MRSNKAQVAPTLTWFIAFIIIFFIIVIFIYFSVAIGAKKQVANILFSGDNLVGLETLSEDSAMSSSLFAVLESRTMVNGTSLRFFDFISKYNSYDHENQLEIKSKLKMELDKLCNSYEFEARGIIIADLIVINPTNELIIQMVSPLDVFTIKYTQARSCQ